MHDPKSVQFEQKHAKTILVIEVCTNNKISFYAPIRLLVLV